MQARARTGTLALAMIGLGAGCARERASESGQSPAAAIATTATTATTSARSQAQAGAVSIELPSEGEQRFRVIEGRSRVGAAVRLAGAVDGATRSHEVLSDGVEDWVVLARRGPTALRWTFEPTPAVAGLRLVDGVLELLDAHGARRLRVARPYTIDARGVRRAATLDVEGCAVDRSPAAPWGRAPISPTPTGAQCTLIVRLDAATESSAAYPLRVDPAWRATTSMATARAGHAAVRLASGKVLAVGGVGSDPSSAELFDPATATWATTASKSAVGLSLPVQLASGAWLFVGAPSVVYDETAGTWSTKAAPSTPRRSATAVRLASGKVLVAGGWTDATARTSAVEIYDPATDAWTSVAPLPATRADHAAATLTNGKVLVAGGVVGAATGPDASALLYDATADAWTTTADLPRAGSPEGASVLADGRVLVQLARPALYVPTAGTWTESATSASAAAGAASTLRGGKLLLAGGTQSDASLVSIAETYDPALDAFAAIGPLATARARATATALASGVLLTGGRDAAGAALMDAEILGDAADGAPCAADGECLAASYCTTLGTCAPKRMLGETASAGRECRSGFAADGVCCDVACDGPCGACDHAGALGTCTAVSGAPKHGTCPGATGSDPCAARACDGKVTATCEGHVGSEVSCRAHACEAGVETAAASCDGSGACPAATTTTCDPYVCDGKQCRTSCRSEPDCATGVPCDAVTHVCVPPVCIDDRTMKGPTGLPFDCAPFHCDSGKCLETCKSSDDCLSAYQCDIPSGQCVANATDGGSSDTGGCQAARAASGGALSGLVLAALGLARRFRRARAARR
jgi:hypothetical protein